MKRQITDHRRASHVAASISLVVYHLSSRVPKKPWGRLRAAHGVSGRTRVRVLSPPTMGGLPRSSSSTVLSRVARVECLSGAKDAPALYGQASCCKAQACDEQECCNTLTGWDDFSHC